MNRMAIRNVRWFSDFAATTLVLVWVTTFWSPAFSQSTFQAGASEVNITPPVGFPHYRGYSTGVHDSLYAKTQYFRQGEVEIAIVECDLLWISQNVSTLTRLKIQDQLGIPFPNVVIAGTHSHTTPAYDG